MSEQNKALIRRIFDEVVGQGRLEVADELAAPDYVVHEPSVPGGQMAGREAFKQFVQMYRSALPDIAVAIQDQIAEGDMVTTRFVMTGTHQGELMGIAPTDRHVTVTAIVIDRIQGGQVVETWGNSDTLGLLQQLGALPSLAPGTST